MSHQFQDPLAREIDRRLRELPVIKAPQQLIPQVLAAIQAQSCQPWWKRSWLCWPTGIRFGFLFVCFALVAAIGYGVSQIPATSLVTAPLTEATSWFGFLKPLVAVVTALSNALVLLIRAGGQVFLWSLAAVAALMYLTCVGLGTVCYRVALNKI